MNAILYRTSSERDAVHKALGTGTTVIVKLAHDDSPLKPSFIFTKSVLGNKNYMYIPDYGRYYYLGKEVNAAAGQVEIECEVDVLMSFKSSFLPLPAVIERQESQANAYIDDENWKMLAKNKVMTRLFPNPVGEGTSLMMCVIGGLGSA